MKKVMDIFDHSDKRLKPKKKVTMTKGNNSEKVKATILGIVTI